MLFKNFNSALVILLLLVFLMNCNKTEVDKTTTITIKNDTGHKFIGAVGSKNGTAYVHTPNLQNNIELNSLQEFQVTLEMDDDLLIYGLFQGSSEYLNLAYTGNSRDYLVWPEIDTFITVNKLPSPGMVPLQIKPSEFTSINIKTSMSYYITEVELEVKRNNDIINYDFCLDRVKFVAGGYETYSCYKKGVNIDIGHIRTKDLHNSTGIVHWTSLNDQGESIRKSKDIWTLTDSPSVNDPRSSTWYPAISINLDN